MLQLLIPILTFVTVTSIGAAVIIARAARRKQLENRLLEAGGFPEDLENPESKRRLVDMLHRTGRFVSAKGPSPSLRSGMAKAGYHSFMAAEIYLGSKILLLVAGLIGLSFVLIPLDLGTMSTILLVIGGATLFSFLPNILVSIRRRARCDEVERALPDAIDLLEICVGAGMGLDMAWNAVADEIRRVSTVLADEMTLTNVEIHLGTPRNVAMKNMAERTDADELSSLASVLGQSAEFGTSVSDALRTFAASMREIRTQKAEEAAEKMAVKLLLPMIVFIFPSVLVVTAGPAGIRLTNLLGG